MKLSGRNVLITGGTAGIGLQLAHDLADLGANVLVCGRASARLDALAANQNQISTVACDVRDHDDVLRLRQFTKETLGTPHILINNAAVFRRVDLLENQPVDDWLEEVDINLMGTLRVTHAFLPAMTALSSATIINLTSPGAYLPLAAAPVYSATKAAVHSWTMSLRHQLRNTNTSVIELNPPAVDTRMNENNPSVEGLKLWSVDDFSKHVVTRLQRSLEKDILVGDAKLVKTMSRLAPSLVFQKMNPAR